MNVIHNDQAANRLAINMVASLDSGRVMDTASNQVHLKVLDRIYKLTIEDGGLFTITRTDLDSIYYLNRIIALKVIDKFRNKLKRG